MIIKKGYNIGMCSLRKDLIDRSINKGVKLNKDLSHRVVAIGFNSKNDMIGIKTNGFGLSNSKGSGKHAERELIKRYGNKIARIVILRIGRGGAILPIDPCETCAKVANKLGIKIESFEEN
jgi:hypothetical protein